MVAKICWLDCTLIPLLLSARDLLNLRFEPGRGQRDDSSGKKERDARARQSLSGGFEWTDSSIFPLFGFRSNARAFPGLTHPHAEPTNTLEL